MPSLYLFPVSRLRALSAAIMGVWLAACSSLPQSPATTTTGFANPKPSQVALTQASEAIDVLPAIDEDIIEEPTLAVSAEDVAEFGDVWARMRHGFQMDLSVDNDRIATQRNWYLQRSDYLDRISFRASRYLFHTVAEAERYGVPSELALLPIIESSYNPQATSHAKAAGMWQFIPSTGRIFGLSQNWWYDGRRDVTESTRAAYEFLSKLHARFGDWNLALAAYNAGPGAVSRAIKRNEAAGLPTDFWSLQLPKETMSYVPRFLAVAQLVQDPAKYDISISPVVNQPHFRIVEANSQIDLAKAAELAGISLKELQQLNPGYSRWATAPDGPHRLLVPIETSAEFDTKLAALPAPERVSIAHYKVRNGDSLYRIAAQYNTTPAELKRLNKLKSNRLRAGQTLVISHSQESENSYRTAASTKAAPQKQQRYSVKRGDTLSTIARRHGTTTKALAAHNNIKTGSTLNLGQRLNIPVGASSRSASKKSSQPIRYEVKKGDTLYEIASRYNVSVSQIKNWNRASNKIKPGQDLVIYVASNQSSRSDNL